MSNDREWVDCSCTVAWNTNPRRVKEKWPPWDWCYMCARQGAAHTGVIPMAMRVELALTGVRWHRYPKGLWLKRIRKNHGLFYRQLDDTDRDSIYGDIWGWNVGRKITERYWREDER